MKNSIRSIIFISIYLVFENANFIRCSHVVYTTQAFYLPISRNLFDNFAREDSVEYRVSMLNMPDLPWWMSYRHPNGSDQAFLYGAPEEPGDINIEVIAMNTKNYDTSRRIINFHVQHRGKEAQYHVELKLLNLNVEDMFEGHRLRQVEEIFRDHLWRTSESVYVTMVASAVDVGGRRPLNPRDKEGVVIRVGGTENFTNDLFDLEREVFPLRKRFPCPKDYRRTTAEHLFRKRDLISDWCSFRLIPAKKGWAHGKDNSDFSSPAILLSDQQDQQPFRFPSTRLPRRDFLIDFVVSIVVPAVLVVFLLTTLTCAFCCHREGMDTQKNSSRVQLSQYNSIQRVNPRTSSSTMPRERNSNAQATNTLPLPGQAAIMDSLVVSTAPGAAQVTSNHLGGSSASLALRARSPNHNHSTMPKMTSTALQLPDGNRCSTLRPGGMPLPPPYTPPR